MISKDLPRHGVGVGGGEEGVVAGREGGPPRGPQRPGARLERAPHPWGPLHLAPHNLGPFTLLKVRVRVKVWGEDVWYFLGLIPLKTL